jgi:hypothetical protein
MPGKHKNKHKGKQGTGDDALPTSPATPTPAENERALKKSQEIKQYLDRQIGDGDMIQYSPVYAVSESLVSIAALTSRPHHKPGWTR